MMAWSRIESKFWQHPKFAGWTAAQKWAMGELIGYCCEYRTEGVIPNDHRILPRSVTPKLIRIATESGWIDVDPDGTRRIHDWLVYHPRDPTAVERVLRNRRKQQRKQVNDETVTVSGTTNTSTNTGKAGKEPSTNQTPAKDAVGSENGSEQTLPDLATVLKDVSAA